MLCIIDAIIDAKNHDVVTDSVCVVDLILICTLSSYIHLPLAE